MKRILQSVFRFFVKNSLGWLLAVINIFALYFFLWYLEGGLHNPTATGCVDGKFTLISTFRYYRGEFLDAVTGIVNGFITLFNLPSLYFSNFISDILFAGQPDCISLSYPEWKYSTYSKVRIGFNILFVIVQWLIIGITMKKLCQLVKKS